MTMQITKATKEKSKLRLAHIGASGSGKTFSALLIAKALSPHRIAVIDTERGSASKYVGDVAEFDKIELTRFEPKQYIEAIAAFAAAGYPVLIIDSLSHAWSGKGGLLDQADARGGKFEAWRHLTPQHNDLVDAILSYPGHVIVTMRAKTEYAVDKDEKGKMTVTKLGTAPIQKDGMEYEFDVVGFFDQNNTMTVVKSRCQELTGAIIRKPGADVAKILEKWLSTGSEPPMELPVGPGPAPAKAAAPPVAKAPTAFERLRDGLAAGKTADFADAVNAAKSGGLLTQEELVALRKLFVQASAKGKAA